MRVEIITKENQVVLADEINRRLFEIKDKLIDIKYSVYVYGYDRLYSCMIIKRID